MSAGCYVRVSTSEQAEHGYSVGEQQDRLRKFCEAMNWPVADVYVDAGFSGANTDRPALKKLISDVKAGLIDRVVVYKLDRLSRSQKDALYLIEDVFLASGCDFVSVTENFDSSTPFGKAALGMIAVFAQLEREQIKERMSMGMIARAKEGKFHGSSTVPIGYDYIDGRLVVNDFEAMQVVKAHELYVSGRGIRSICEEFNAAGFTHKHGRWLAPTMRNVLAKRTYIGETYYSGAWYKGEHDPIISPELFAAADRMKNRKHEDYLRKGTRDGMATSYLGGLLFCAHCGAKYIKCAHYNHYKGKSEKVDLYKCNSRAKKTKDAVMDPNCKNKIWKMSELDALICAEIEKLALDDNFLDEDRKIDSRRSEASILALEIERLDDQILRLMDLYSLGSIPLDLLQQKTEGLKKQKESLEEMRRNAEMANGNVLNRRDMAEKVKSFGDVLKRGNLAEIRALLSALIERIELDGDDVTIYWRFN